MKKFIAFFLLIIFSSSFPAQELLANVQVNYSQIGGSNVQVFKTLEKSLRDFINNTSWTGKKLQNFEKIKCNFSIIISSRPDNNSFKGSIVVQAVRPTFDSTYESPLLNLNDTNFAFTYTENENLIFNERQFSGKNLIDVISFYVYTVLGYDADSFKSKGGEDYFQKAQKISQNSQNQNFAGWSIVEGPKTRAGLIDGLLNENSNILRNTFYVYHRSGMDNLSKQDQSGAKQNIANSLLQLKAYENNFQLNYPFSLFIDTKNAEIFNIFNTSNNGSVNMNDLKTIMSTFDPKDIESKWNVWK
ncbi:type IX secretion system protein PorD [Halpernia sp. GG3]